MYVVCSVWCVAWCVCSRGDKSYKFPANFSTVGCRDDLIQYELAVRLELLVDQLWHSGLVPTFRVASALVLFLFLFLFFFLLLSPALSFPL